ncbi:hypothetical protein G7Y79_00032g066580 [Physcia stellaris]|nr:hypothetical protein G7Y79_00032g066580 [Physcia stellaris]
MLRPFDGIAEDGRQFLVNLQPKLRPNLSIQDWIEIVWAQFIDQASEWINNVKEIMDMIDKGSSDEVDKTRFVQLICEKYPAVKKSVVKESVIKESVVSSEQHPIKHATVNKPVANLIGMQQGQDETVREYYQRIHDALVETGRKDILLSVVVLRNWIDGLNNKKLARHLASRPVTDQSSLYDVCTIAERKLLQKRQKKEARKALQQQLQDIVDREVARTQISYESLHFLEQIRPEVLEICTAVDITDIETPASTASEYAKWIIASTSLQKPSPEACSVDESPLILEEMPCNLSETSTNIVDPSDIEATDEILASGPGKWIAPARMEVFGYTSTSDEASKKSPAPDTDIEASDTSFGWSRCGTVDMEALNQEVFALAATFDAFSKNPPASSPEDLEVSVAMDMPSLKHLMDMNGPAIEAFDSGTAMGASLKNPSSQHIEDSETLEKDSAHTLYELPALPAFDLSLDIDFQTYATDIETPSFGWSRCCTNPIGSSIPSVSTCTSAPAVTATTSDATSETTAIDFCEGEQLSCSTMNPSILDTDFYGGEQSLCSPVDDIVDAVYTADSVMDTHAPTLTAGLVNTTMNPAWISLLGPIEDVAPKPKHKGLPKVKIK